MANFRVKICQTVTLDSLCSESYLNEMHICCTSLCIVLLWLCQGQNTNVCYFNINSAPRAFNSALNTALSKSKKLKCELVVQ